MEHNQRNIKRLQDSLMSPSLDPNLGCKNDNLYHVLLGKILSNRSFRRYIVSKIIMKTWGTSAKVHIKKIGNNTSNSLFGSK